MQPALIVFVGGAVYRHWINNEKKMKKKTLKKLAEYFQEPLMLEPLSINYEKWDQNHSINGAPVACFPPGLLSIVKDLRKPEGRIHWSGT
jgi:monoamine oxidase